MTATTLTGNGARDPEDFQACLAQLQKAIARAERWCAHQERALADFDRRAADIVGRLVAAGMVRPPTARRATEPA